MTPCARASCFNCAEGLRPERLARRLKRGGLTREVLPALDYHVAIFGVEFHHPRKPSVRFTCNCCRSRPCETIQDLIAAFGVVQHLVLEQCNGLRCRVLCVAARPVKLKDGGLLTVCRPQVTCATFPAEKTGFVFPVVVLPAHNHRLFFPDKALTDLPPHVVAC